MSATTELKRAQLLPLHLPEDIYTVLSRLEIGQRVPSTVLISDYQDDEIPPWTVAEIERGGGDLLVLTVYDAAQGMGTWFEPWVAMDVFTQSTKTLAGPFFAYYPGSGEHRRNPLADIRQHARVIVDKARKAEKRGAA